MLIVQKFGGSSVADGEKIHRVAGIIARTKDEGNHVVVVLSAQGNTTDDLLEKAGAISPSPPERELDMLMSTGEQASVALMAMCLEEMGYEAISLNGAQAGICTDGVFGDARIVHVDTKRIRRELDCGKIVIVAGFQGTDELGDVTTLGRGGSDTTAVALAAALNADCCQIFTDVEGVYTADPRKVPDAVKLDEVTYDEMLELIHNGAQVLHDRCVELAKAHGITLEVLSSYVQKPGTKVHE